MANELTIDLTSGACVLGLTLAAASSQVRRHNGVRSWRDEEWFGVVLGLWIVHNHGVGCTQAMEQAVSCPGTQQSRRTAWAVRTPTGGGSDFVNDLENKGLIPCRETPVGYGPPPNTWRRGDFTERIG